MANNFTLASVLFITMYDRLKDELIAKGNREQITSLDEALGSIEEEGFINGVDNSKFVYTLFNVILRDYVINQKGEVELGEMWKIFRKLRDNGMHPTDERSQKLYLDLAKTIIRKPRGGRYNEMSTSPLDVIDKTKFVMAGLDSFDTSEYLFKSLAKVAKDCFVQSFYSFYADFIKKIADVSNYEMLTYLMLAEQVDRKDASDGMWPQRGLWIAESADTIARQLQYKNHYGFSEHQDALLFGRRIEDIMESHKSEIDERGDNGYPILIKAKNRTRNLPDSKSRYYTDTLDL